MAFNLLVFRFPYSVFGTIERTAPPDERPLDQAKATRGWIGWFGALSPFFSWRLYRSGLGFSILGVGTGFVPLEDMTEFRKAPLGGGVVRHTCQEVRSPLWIPSRRLFEHLQELYELRELPAEGAGGGTSSAADERNDGVAGI